ncbi:hypothetical protein OHA70_09760 [Kribbella sp. NBC_00382]|uniref:DUF6652 family protein n=1 Tax=Kribbella sp. NBC_00382 TaxID=2975967 RepID=UPI002E241B54
MAKALGGCLGVGAILMALVAAAIGLKEPFRIDEPGDLTVPFVLLGGWMAVYLVLAALAIADAVRLAQRRDLDALQRSANLVKLVGAGFFVLNFVALVEAVALIGSDDGIDGIVAALLFLVLTYLVFLPTSAYTVACLVLLRKDDRIGRVFFGVNLTLQFLFVVDVPSTVVVVESSRHILGISRRPGVVSRNLLAGVLIAGSLLSTVWLILVALYWLADQHRGFVTEGIFVLNAVPPVEFVLLLLPVVPLVTFRTAVRYFVAGDLAALRRSARIVGLAMIPLYAQMIATCTYIVFVVTAFISIYGSYGDPKPANVAIIGAVTSIGLTPAVLAALLMLLPISTYGVTAFALRMRQRVV